VTELIVWVEVKRCPRNGRPRDGKVFDCTGNRRRFMRLVHLLRLRGLRFETSVPVMGRLL
jgi:hypothetical protein